MCQSIYRTRQSRVSKSLSVPAAAGAGSGAALGYTLVLSTQAGAGLCLCGALSGALLGGTLPRFVSDEEMRRIHWTLFVCGILLAGAVLFAVTVSMFDPTMFALCPFCGQPLA
jgi:drug/metabolite transporter (DMT)-like permease